MQRFRDVVLVEGPNGLQPLPTAQVAVYLAGTQTLANIFSNNTGSPKENPMQVDSLGEFYFYAEDGRYDLKISAPGYVDVWVRDVLLDDPEDNGYLTDADIAVKAGVVDPEPGYGSVPSVGQPDGEGPLNAQAVVLTAYAKANRGRLDDIENSSDPLKGAAKVGYEGSTVAAKLTDLADQAVAADNAISDLQERALSGNFYSYETEADMLADVANRLEGDSLRVTNDPDSAKDGYYTVYSGVAVRSGLQPVSPQDIAPLEAYTSLSVNAGKIYPLNAATRDGIVSPESGGIGIPYWNNAILKVRVIGSPEQIAGKYFRIAALDNGAFGRFGVQIEEFDASTYATASVATVIQQRTDGNFNYGVALGVTTIVVEPVLRQGLQIEITIDGAGLPPSGTPMVATTSETPAWSWIVDPSCVETNEAMAYDTLRSNYDKPFPLRAEKRAAIISPPNTAFNAALLAINVDGADKGRFYRVEYFVNEDTALVGADPFGWVLASYDAATYSVDDNAGRILLHNYTDPAPAIDRTKGIQTVVITCANAPNVTFHITLDSTRLPPAGTAIRSLTPSQTAGRSWIVDPSQYVLRQQSVTPTASSGNLAIEASATDILVGFASQADCYQLVFGPNGANDLPNIKAVNRANGVDLDAASWAQISSSTTDWLPPLLFQKADIPPRSGLWFTGGNHLIDGYPTAENIQYQVLIDGAPLSAFDRRGRRVDIKIVNRLMAANTVVAPGSVTDANYVALQKFWLRFYESGAVFIRCRVQALQDLLFQRDYGPQVVGTGFNDTVMIAAGQQGGRVAWANGLDSGPSSSYPKANALTLRSAANGQLASWIDRDFGSANRTIDPTEPLVRAAPTSGDKMYQLAFLDTTGIPMAAGEFYEWQGGYFLSSARAGANGIDSTIDYGDGFQSIFTNASYV